jgi:hypothetical protein
MYGILDDNAIRRISQDLREADFRDAIGEHEFAQYLRKQVDELRKLDSEICKAQVLEQQSRRQFQIVDP